MNRKSHTHVDRARVDELLQVIADSRDRPAFLELFGTMAPRVKAYVMRLGCDPATADDLVQEVMLTIWRRAGQFDARKASGTTWIFTIARNRRIDFFRRENRPEFDPNDPALTPDGEEPADHVLEQRQDAERLRDAVAQLPAEQAQLLHQAYFEELSHVEIAERTDLPLGTVKSRLRLAKDKLRQALEGTR